MLKRRKKYKDMSLDQQIQVCENQISKLEQAKRMMITRSGDLRNTHHEGSPESELCRINADLPDFDSCSSFFSLLKS
jgi:mannitol-specific phosphotransferase system IIBC component